MGRPLFWLASEVEELGAADIDGTHRAHLMAAVAVDAPVVPDLCLAAYDGDGMRRTALGTASAADTVLPADYRAGGEMIPQAAHCRAQQPGRMAEEVHRLGMGRHKSRHRPGKLYLARQGEGIGVLRAEPPALAGGNGGDAFRGDTDDPAEGQIQQEGILAGSQEAQFPGTAAEGPSPSMPTTASTMVRAVSP